MAIGSDRLSRLAGLGPEQRSGRSVFPTSATVLALWGEYDRQTPPGESLTTFRETFDSVDHPSYTLRVIREADHALHQTSDEGFTRSDDSAPGYFDLVASWIDELAGGAPASRANPAPSQGRTTQPVEPLAWYESPSLTLGTFVVLVVVFVGYAAVALVRRIRGRRSGADVKPARWLAASGLLASATKPLHIRAGRMRR